MSQQPHVAIGPKGTADYQKLKVDSSGNLMVSPVGAGGSADTKIIGGNSNLPVTTTLEGVKVLLDVSVHDIHISHTSDSIQIGDGTRTAGVTANNELKVSGIFSGGPLEAPTNTDFIKAINSSGSYIVKYYAGGVAGTLLKTLTFSNPGNEFELAIS